MTLISALTELGGSLSELVVDIFASISKIFVTTTEQGAMHVTVFGYLALIGFITSFIGVALTKLFGLIRKR